jgi:SAM-dependent methyltransferase
MTADAPPLSVLHELADRSVMRGEMWDDLAGLDTWRSWSDLRAEFASEIYATFARWVARDQAHFREQLIFALGRFDEGAGLLRHFEWFAGRTLRAAGERVRFLDIGAGNGGVAIALANYRKYEVFALDLVPNPDLTHLRRRLQLPIGAIVGNGERLPLADGSMDVILLLDMIEHVPHPRSLASEVMRVLRAGGVCMLTTPPRLRHLLKPDPHYGIRGLVTLPNPLQRFVVNHIFRRRMRDESGNELPAYDVSHIYWHVREIARLFPGPHEIEVLYNYAHNPGRKYSRDRLLYNTREFFWDRIKIYKLQHQ